MANKGAFELPKHRPAHAQAWVGAAYALSVGMVLLGIVFAGVGGGSGVRTYLRGTHRLTLPGSASLKLPAGLSVGLQDPRSTATVGGLFVTVLDEETSQPYPVDMGPGGLRVSGGLRPLFQVRLPDPAKVLVTGAVSGPPLPILLIHESVFGWWSDILVGVVSGLLLAGGGAYVFWFTRRRVRDAGKTRGT